MKRSSLLGWVLLLAVLPLLAGCSSDNAAKLANSIAGGAAKLRGSSLGQVTVRLDLGTRKPYVVVIYPPFRTAADEAALDKVVPKAAAVSYGGAAISPKSEGFVNTLVVWQNGSLATFSTSFRSAAEAQHVLAVAKDDGSPAEVTLTRHDGQVYITAIR